MVSGPLKTLVVFEERSTLFAENKVLILEHGNKLGMLLEYRRRYAPSSNQFSRSYDRRLADGISSSKKLAFSEVPILSFNEAVFL